MRPSKIRCLLRSGILVVATALSVPSCGGDSSGPRDPSSPSVASVGFISSPATVFTMATAQMAAVARDANGNVITGRSFSWRSDGDLVARVSQTGAVTGVSPGTVIITASEIGSGISGSLQVTVNAPPRPVGSLLAIGSDSVPQFGSHVYVSTLGMVDTATAGNDYRVGIIRLENAQRNPSISRSNFPQLSAVAECADGVVHAASFSELNGREVSLWRLDPRTAVVTLLSVFPHPGVIRTMVCEGSGSLLVSAYFAVQNNIYRIPRNNPTTRSLVRTTSDIVVGFAVAPTGTIFATVYDIFDSSASQGQLLVTVNPVTGVFTPTSAGQIRRLPHVTNLAFRGSRLLGLTNGLVEINTVTGVITQIRSFRIP